MNYYNNSLLISKENEEIFTDSRKHNLNVVEKIGLEHILQDFIAEYEESQFGEVYTNIIDYTRYNQDSIDFLDGYADTYIFDNYAIGDIWMLDNGVVCMTCADLESYTGEDVEAFEMSELAERPNSFDLWSDFDQVIFRLN